MRNNRIDTEKNKIKKKIFLTGATGVMGLQGLKMLTANSDLYEITALVRDSRKNRKLMAPFLQQGVRIIWGDMLHYDSIDAGVSHADIVLHVGGLVSPLADWTPELTIKTNVGAIENIIRAAEKRVADIKIVNIGSVAQYGNREVPNHWGKVGDTLKPALFDAYAYSKTVAERLLMESHIKHWVSLRQTGILHSGLLRKASDPIAFHVPLRGVLEWVTAEDSGNLLEKICRENLPDTFWRKCYNIGGGKNYRMTNYEFEKRLLKAMGCPAPEKIFEPQWFATQNFHGMWFADSEILEDFLHFRANRTPEEYFRQMKSELPWYFKLSPLAPAIILKCFMRRVAKTPILGPLWWLENNKTERINAAWGSRQEWAKIPDWRNIDLSRPDDNVPEIQCENEDSNLDDLISRQCDECGGVFTLRLRTLKAGHTCPACLRRRVSAMVSDKEML